MKKILCLFSVLFLFSLSACDDNQRQGSISCNLSRIAANSDCLAEDLRFQCTYFGCEGETLRIDLDPRNCIPTDCATLVCDTIGVENGEEIQLPGSLMDLAVDIEAGLPIGLFVADGFEEEVLCNLAIISN